MNGRKLYVSPQITANGVLSSWSLLMSPTSRRPPLNQSSRNIVCVCCAPETSSPLLPRMFCQASVRMRKLVKNGAMTRTRRTFFSRPERWAMNHASG